MTRRKPRNWGAVGRASGDMTGQQETRPNPDPSTLTTDALNREVGYLRNLLENQQEAAERLAGALRDSDAKFEAERDRRISEVALERDRRLTEVATEREKALKIKEEADKEALRLDREIRQFKDEKAGAVTAAAVGSIEQRLVPIDRYVAAQQGQVQGHEQARSRHDISFGQIIGMVTVALIFLSAVIAGAALIIHG